MPDTSYATVEDLLIGEEIPLPSYVNPQKFLNDAADEVDSCIGFRYTTPLDFSETSTLVRPARLLIKRIVSHLATGRLLMQIAIPSEDVNLNAYGLSLVKNALDALEQIEGGNPLLDGAETVNPEADPGNGPQINNLDNESAVEAFYDRIANPNYTYTPWDRRRYPSHYAVGDGLIL